MYMPLAPHNRRIQFLQPPQIHRRIQQRVNIRVKSFPVGVVEVVGLGLGERLLVNDRGWWVCRGRN
jgi:hypothetical protein